ncbi:penicillin-binding protein 2 [Sphingomonas lacunae]|uniref:Penicillin-binding protein 2 n=1 Tax=Sphingomonas lacunae TaxID=2698828 RepID=A0A6M4AX55_9SPHN|nr:penicillin-binding protein 2 [Sphingomonas lacunae]QJQ32932.1 penicillin-binding protein 2 [Sphingomonas lacunae]
MKFRWRRSNPRPDPGITEGMQRLTFTRRAMLVSGAQVGVAGLLAARMTYLSVVDNERYTLLSESNRVNLTLIPPRRGWIVDRYGKALADNRVALRVDIIPDRLDNRSAVITRLTELLQLDNDTVDRINRELDAGGGAQPVEVAADLDETRYAAVSVNLPELPGVVPARGFVRNYPAGPSVAHLIGYVGSASAEQYKESRDPLLLTPGFKVGKDGIEKDFENELRGRPGARRAEVTARGKLVRELATTNDTPGSTLQLTIDADLQDYAARRLGTESGAVVVLDVTTGGILALCSMPAFDPNSFTDGIGRLEWKMLNEDDHIPLLNKAMRGLYPPGSTLKPMIAVAFQAAGVDPEETVFCNGGYTLGNRRFGCLGRHGSINMRHAIEKSCNTYFYAMGKRVGFDAIAPVAKAFGLGEEFELPGTRQRYGTVPDSAWKRRRFDQAWSVSDTLNATIGQGYMSVNPLQLAVMTARLATGRKVEPRLLLDSQAALPDPLPYSPDFFHAARQGMDWVVNAAGTGARSRLAIPNIRMGGKTGTAQVRGIRGSNRGQSGEWRFRDHGLFVCFAPVDEPRYAAAVVIEHGLGGARAAAPVAKDVLTFLYDRTQALETLASLEAGWGGTMRDRLQRRYAAYQAAAANPMSPAPTPPEVGAATGAPPAAVPNAPPAATAPLPDPGASVPAPTAAPAAPPAQTITPAVGTPP